MEEVLRIRVFLEPRLLKLDVLKPLEEVQNIPVPPRRLRSRDRGSKPPNGSFWYQKPLLPRSAGLQFRPLQGVTGAGTERENRKRDSGDGSDETAERRETGCLQSTCQRNR